MFCNNCIKLAYLHTKKKCIKCQSEVLNNISVLCIKCAGTEGVCSVCLKHTSRVTSPVNYNKGCRSCGGR